jgi:thioredoxin 1
MKKFTLMIVLAVFALHSCGQTNSKGTSEESNNSVSFQQVAEKTDGGSIKLTKSVFLDKVWDYEKSPEAWVYKGDKPALIDFYADWCGPCKIASPILEEISHEYAKDIYVYKIDTEVEKELAAVFGIRGIPAFLYIPAEGKPVMMSGIARTKDDTKKMFKENIDKYLLTVSEILPVERMER